MHFVYIVRCRDESLYTGYTTQIERRIKEHNGELPGGAKYTAHRAPVILAYKEEFETESDAKKREYAIKQLSRGEKIALVESKALHT